ncbi:MAG TPA: AzlD domain-containing protein [Ramlibacter sp.]|jgi:branched-subunit amino acid transport protein|uniref:AzlD domain-containing protein n=1 Tax=Ramlibacter sp. TaxID=1917967 RepID=UPI002D69C714|nr:AzlD domain-containing protein [Ramlibacter sp.]HZY17095.1 AzlD domain-containing protein [Ramlibacter sp.]
MTDLWTVAVIVGLAAVTVVARSFFFLSSRPWSLPRWAERGLQYAPIAALSAVVVPEVVTLQGQLVHGWDARIFGAIAGAVAFYWRRNVLVTIVAGMAVYVPLHLGLGW